MMRLIARLLVSTLLLAVGIPCHAVELESLPRYIDRVINESMEKSGVTPSKTIDDAAFLRRVALDLAGRIPTRKEFDEFLADTDTAKREKLVDRLLESEDYDFHTRNELDIQLLARLKWDNDWRSYLLEAVRDRRSWDRVVSEILIPEKLIPGNKGAAAFLKQRAKDLDAMTNDTSTLLFGVNIACAKCHDHPLVPDWHQDHYYGFAKFFKRTFSTRSGLMAERFDGDLKFTTTSNVEKEAAFMFLNGKSIAEPSFQRSDDEWKEIRAKLKQAESSDKAEPPPIPSFSPREKLLELAVEEGSSSLLARNFANRVWARLMRHGLIHPIDQIHSGNPPSHPKLLDFLAKKLVENQYDMRSLLRGIVMSDTYARGPAAESGAPSLPEQFASQPPRAMTPFQYSLSLWIASRNPETLPGEDKPSDWLKMREEWELRSESFARSFEIPDSYFQVSVEEALFFSNNPQIESDLFQNRSDTLVGYLSSQKDSEKLINELYLSVLSRLPEPQEQETLRAFLDARIDRRENALQQAVWALLTSAEFRFNH